MHSFQKICRGFFLALLTALVFRENPLTAETTPTPAKDTAIQGPTSASAVSSNPAAPPGSPLNLCKDQSNPSQCLAKAYEERIRDLERQANILQDSLTKIESAVLPPEQTTPDESAKTQALLTELSGQLDLLRRTQLFVGRQQRLSGEIARLETQLSEEGKISSGEIAPSLPDKPSFALLESLRDQLLLQESATKRSESALSIITREKEDTTEQLKQQESAIRLQNDQQAIGASDSTESKQRALLEISATKEQLASLQLASRKIELEKQLVERKVANLSRQVDFLSAQVTLNDDYVAERLGEIDAKEKALRQLETTAKRELTKYERSWEDVRTRLQVDPNSQLLSAELEAKNAHKERLEQNLNNISRQLVILSMTRQIWDNRKMLISGNYDLRAIRSWKETVERRLRLLESDLRLTADRREELDKLQFATEERIERLTPEAQALSPQLSEMIKAIKRSVLDQLEYQEFAENYHRLFLRFLGELNAAERNFSWHETLETCRQYFLAAWNFELTVIDDQPITPHKLTLALILFLLGYKLSRYLSRNLRSRVLSHFARDNGITYAVETLSFYFFVTLSGIVALNIVNVPLTVFTLLGGALAIGIGFGSQTVVNNFISGIILLVERPVRVGDIIELDNTIGTVQHIGLRSTILRSGKNTDILVPNAGFLDKRIINWTLTDNRISTSILVTLSHNTDIERAQEILLESVKDVPGILAEPRPSVFLADVAPMGLTFELAFSLLVPNHDRSRLQSELRQACLRRFAAEGITLAQNLSVFSSPASSMAGNVAGNKNN